MINSAKEFKHLRESEDPKEYERAASEEASIETWLEVISSYPELAFWVAQNKTVPMEILYQLAQNNDSKVRSMVARKRKLDDQIFNTLKEDTDESVRYSLMCNTKLSIEKKMLIKTEDSVWLKQMLDETVANTKQP